MLMKLLSNAFILEQREYYRKKLQDSSTRDQDNINKLFLLFQSEAKMRGLI